MKNFQRFLLVLIIIGVVLLVTQKVWVSRLVSFIMKYDSQLQVVSVTKNTATKPKPTKETYYYHLTTCWGNPPQNYMDLVKAEQDKINLLKQKYNVIIVGCPAGIQ